MDCVASLYSSILPIYKSQYNVPHVCRSSPICPMLNCARHIYNKIMAMQLHQFIKRNNAFVCDVNVATDGFCSRTRCIPASL